MMMFSGGPGPTSGTGPRFVWNRGLSVSGFYTYGQNYDNTDGAFAIPATSISRPSGDRRVRSAP